VSSEYLTTGKLIQTALAVSFEVVDQKIEESAGGDEALVEIALQLGETEEDGELSNDVEWGAIPFVYTLAALSFSDARPRGLSDRDFEDDDQLTTADLLENLEFRGGTLYCCMDYVRGRCVKTDIRVQPDGRLILATRCRGEAALHWVERLKGKKRLGVVEAREEP